MEYLIQGFSTSLSLEHPKQQPCSYATALRLDSAAASVSSPRPPRAATRAATVSPPSYASSSWR